MWQAWFCCAWQKNTHFSEMISYGRHKNLAAILFTKFWVLPTFMSLIWRSFYLITWSAIQNFMYTLQNNSSVILISWMNWKENRNGEEICPFKSEPNILKSWNLIDCFIQKINSQFLLQGANLTNWKRENGGWDARGTIFS